MLDVAVCGIYSNTLLVNLNGRDCIVGEDAITLSFLKSSGDESSLTAGNSDLHSDSVKAGVRKRAPSPSLVEDVSVYEAPKRSQISGV